MNDRESFLSLCDVSRETEEKLAIYEDTLRKWNPRINLVARSTLIDIWNRHFLDSATLKDQIPQHPGRWVDMGSGAGFPALIILILANDKDIPLTQTCIETDIRKSEFLKTVARGIGLPINVFSRRIEDCPPQSADVVTARALTSLPNLLRYANRHLKPDGVALFHKGQDWQSEVKEARREWSFDYETIPSLTQPGAVVLKIGGLTHG